MKHILKICVIMMCFMLVALANADSRVKVEDRAAEQIGETPYRPSLLQDGVLFVEDGSGYYPPTNPDPVWDGVLTDILGAGNYGWFGPTFAPGDDGPDLATMQMYELVIWNNYDHWDAPTLTANDMTNIENYLTGGGKVWLIGQDILYSGVPISFLINNFNLASAIQDYASTGTLTLQGLNEIPDSTITVQTDLINDFFPDALTPDADAHHVILDVGNSQNPAILNDGATASFWTADGRLADPWSNWVIMVQAMLNAFQIVGVEETPLHEPAHRLQLSVTPDPLVHITTIRYTLPVAGNVSLQVFNNVGQQIITLVNGSMDAGSYAVAWKGKDVRGANVPNGVYFVKLTCNDLFTSRELVVLK